MGLREEEPEVREARAAIPNSPVARRLLSRRAKQGQIPGSPYARWTGAHWTLVLLADLGYPPGDKALIPLRDQAYDLWLSRSHVVRVRVIDGRARRCGSQEGNALYAALALGSIRG